MVLNYDLNAETEVCYCAKYKNMCTEILPIR